MRRPRGPRYHEPSLRVGEAGGRGADAALFPGRGEEPRARAARRGGAARRQPLEPARSAAGRRGLAAAALVPGEGGAVPDPVVRAADPAAQRAAGPARGAGPRRAPDGAARPRGGRRAADLPRGDPGRGGGAPAGDAGPGPRRPRRAYEPRAASARSNPMTGGTGGMKTDEPKHPLGGPRKEGHEAAEERMEDWFREGATSEFEEGEVVRGRVVQVTPTEVLVDVGYKSEGAIPIEEFHRHGKLPKVGDQIEVYLEAKEDSEGLIVLSKDKADKIKVWDAF